MTDVTIQKKNEVYLTVECEPHIKYELSEFAKANYGRGYTEY